MYRKSGNFHCKNIFIVDGGYKMLRKFVRTINANMVRGRSYENLLYEFLDMKISRSTV